MSGAASDLLRNRKERRRATINRNYMGDYLGFAENPSLRQLVEKRERVEFANTVLLYDRKFRTSRSDLLLTQRHIYFVALEKIAKGPDKGKIVNVVRRRIPLQGGLQSLSMSTLADDFVVLHTTGAPPDDVAVVFETVLKTEFLTLVCAKFQEAVNRPLPLAFNDAITYTVERSLLDRSGSRTLKFSPGGVKGSVLRKSGKDATVLVESGLPRDSVPSSVHAAPTTGAPRRPSQPQMVRAGSSRRMGAPPAAAAAAARAAMGGARAAAAAAPPPTVKKPPVKPRRKVPQCRALYDYESRDVDELSLKVGDVIQIVSNSNEGWWQGKLGGRTGLFPANYVEMLP